MWIPKSVIEWFNISQNTVSALREENAALRAEYTALSKELTSTKVNLDWLRMQFNQLQLERTALVDKLYGIKVPTPELVTRLPKLPSTIEDFGYDDMGDEMAKRLGLPTYDN